MELTNSIQKEILTKHQIRNTPIRQQILSIFQDVNQAISPQDIEKLLGDNSDRVTVYRTLQKFLEHGLVHQIEDGNQTYYALCDDCEVHDHADNHVHFKCNCCKKIQCVHTDSKLQFSLPKGYQIDQMKVLLEGTCASCKS